MIQIKWGGSSKPALNQAIKEWIEQRIWTDGRVLPPSVTMGMFDDGAIVAGVAFHDWQPVEGVIEISAASDTKRWLTRPVLHAMFSYVFETAGCQLAVARIDPENKSLCRIFKAYGFEEYFIPRLMGRDKGQTILTLTEEAWRMNKFERKAA